MIGNTVETVWEVVTYDVWGNSRSGYEVNDSYSHGEHSLTLDVVVNNQGSEREFLSAYPTKKQIQKLFGIRFKIDLDGDSTRIEVTRKSDAKPIGYLTCVSYKSLSPIEIV